MGSSPGHAELIKAKYYLSENGSVTVWRERANDSTIPRRMDEVPNRPFLLQAIFSMIGGRDDSASAWIAHSTLKHRLLQMWGFAGTVGRCQTKRRMLITTRAVMLCVLPLMLGAGSGFELRQPIGQSIIGKGESDSGAPCSRRRCSIPISTRLEVDLTGLGPADPLASREPAK